MLFDSQVFLENKVRIDYEKQQQFGEFGDADITISFFFSCATSIIPIVFLTALHYANIHVRNILCCKLYSIAL